MIFFRHLSKTDIMQHLPKEQVWNQKLFSLLLVHLFSYAALAESNIPTFEKHLNEADCCPHLFFNSILIPHISLTSPFWQSFGASILLK